MDCRKHVNFDLVFLRDIFAPTVFPHIVAAATIHFELIKAWKFHIASSLGFPVCNENLNRFLTRWGNYSREETIWGYGMYLQALSSLECNCISTIVHKDCMPKGLGIIIKKNTCCLKILNCNLPTYCILFSYTMYFIMSSLMYVRS